MVETFKLDGSFPWRDEVFEINVSFTRVGWSETCCAMTGWPWLWADIFLWLRIIGRLFEETDINPGLFEETDINPGLFELPFGANEAGSKLLKVIFSSFKVTRNYKPMPADCWAGKAASAKFKKSGTVGIVSTRSRNNTYAMITLQIGRGHEMVPCQF